MKKPIIKNWIKYWTSTIAVSGLLVMGACGDSNETAEVEDIDTQIEEPVRENVAAVETEDTEAFEEPETTTQETEEAPQKVTATSNYPATYIQDMDAHLKEHKEVNERITEELTDANSQLQDGTTSDPQERSQYGEDGNINQTRGENQSQEMQPDQNMTQGTMDPTQQNASLDNNVNQQDTANIYDKQSNTNINEGPDAYFLILEEVRADYDPEGQQAMDNIVKEYNERRESMRGQMDPETGAYTSPETDPQPKQGIAQLMDQIHNNLQYPHNAMAAEIEGTVFVNFIVDENGKIIQAEAVPNLVVPASEMQYTQPLNPTKFSEQEIEETKKNMMEEAVKAVKATSGQWEPAMNNGEIVKAELQLPVVFDLESVTGVDDYNPEAIEKEEE